MKYQFNDGGRKEAGFKGITNDCVVRAIAIVTRKPYNEVYDNINVLCKDERITKRHNKQSSARTGVWKKTMHTYLLSLGFKWTPTMFIGSGCKVHLKDGELPDKDLIVRVSKHLTAVVNGTIHDNHDPQRNGTRCVYGYYSKEGEEE